jgi:hypothetical protein
MVKEEIDKTLSKRRGKTRALTKEDLSQRKASLSPSWGAVWLSAFSFRQWRQSRIDHCSDVVKTSPKRYWFRFSGLIPSPTSRSVARSSKYSGMKQAALIKKPNSFRIRTFEPIPQLALCYYFFVRVLSIYWGILSDFIISATIPRRVIVTL